MAVNVAEYLGIKTETNPETIFPVSCGDCPFVNNPCVKLRKTNPPVCSVRKKDGKVWIVCSHRLCCTSKKTKINGVDVKI